MTLYEKIKWRLDFIKLIFKNKSDLSSLKSRIGLLLPEKWGGEEKRIKSLAEFGKSFVISRNGDKVIIDLQPVAKSSLKLVIKDEEVFYWTVGASALEVITEGGIYEHEPVVLRQGDIVVDAGANLGIFTISAASKIGLAGKVYAFEPIVSIRDILTESAKFNQLKNIEIEPFALGNSQQNLELFFDNNNPGAASGILNRGENRAIVEQITLDKFVKENNISQIDFIKADIEGMERNLLAGAEATIRRFKPGIAICIYHLPDDSEVLQSTLSKLVSGYKFIKTEKKLYAYI